MTVTRLLAIGLLALALAGCGSDSKDEAASDKSAAPPPASTTATTADCQPLAGAKLTAQKSPESMNPQPMYLTDVFSIEPETCSVRVVFEFEKQPPGPGFDVSYQPASTAKIEDGSGNPIEVAGEAFLVVKLTAMTAKIDGDQVTKTYTGPRRVTGPAPIEEVVKTGDFEGVVTWVIGLDRKRPFTTASSDSVLVVEIDHVLP